MFGLCMWLRLDPGFQEWVEFLDMYEFYIGIYILLAASIFVIIITFVGCGVALMEYILGLCIVRYSIDIQSITLIDHFKKWILHKLIILGNLFVWSYLKINMVESQNDDKKYLELKGTKIIYGKCAGMWDCIERIIHI